MARKTDQILKTVPGRLPCDYRLRVPSQEPTHLTVLLHGYGLSAETMLRLCGTAIPDSHAVLSLSGPFPIPERKREFPTKWRMGFSWYFYNFETDEYVVDMSIALEHCAVLLSQIGKERGWSELPINIVGFSQGGYLSPFLAQSLGARVKRVLGMGCRFLHEELQGDLTFELSGIHGKDDDIISSRESQESFERLKSRTLGGEWIGIDGVGHRITHEVQAELGRLLSNSSIRA